MRLRTGHKPEDWTENMPSSVAWPQHPRGEIIVGQSGAYERSRQAKAAQKERDAALLREALGRVAP